MKLSNEVHIGEDPGTVFDTLLDVEKLAGCMPGSTLLGKDGDAYRGEVKVKVGPLGVAYQGTVRFLEIDRDARTAVLKASGKEKSGQGNADAHVTARVLPDGDGSKVAIETDLLIRGKAAQFGRGVIGEVSQRLIGQFARNVENLLSGKETAPTSTAAPAASATPDASATPAAPATGNGEAAAMDGLALVAVPLLKRLAPVGAGIAIGLLAGLGLGRRRSRGGLPLPKPGNTAWLLIPVTTKES